MCATKWRPSSNAEKHTMYVQNVDSLVKQTELWKILSWYFSYSQDAMLTPFLNWFDFSSSEFSLPEIKWDSEIYDTQDIVHMLQQPTELSRMSMLQPQVIWWSPLSVTQPRETCQIYIESTRGNRVQRRTAIF